MGQRSFKWFIYDNIGRSGLNLDKLRDTIQYFSLYILLFENILLIPKTEIISWKLDHHTPAFHIDVGAPSIQLIRKPDKIIMRKPNLRRHRVSKPFSKQINGTLLLIYTLFPGQIYTQFSSNGLYLYKYLKHYSLL